MSRSWNHLIGSCICVMMFYSSLSLLSHRSDSLKDVSKKPKRRDEAVLVDDPINGTVMRYTSRTEPEWQRAEESFVVSREQMTSIGFPLNLSGVKPLTEDTFYDFVFVTAASSNHFHEAMEAIAVIQKHFPNHTLFYYDLDVDQSIGTVNKIKQLCNVVYCKFNYTAYPKHVQNLRTYAFKPLVIYDILLYHKTLFWMDASVRFHTDNLDAIRQQLLNSSSDVMLFDDTGHSIFAATHVTMYRYLPISKSAAVNVTMRGATIMFIHCSQQLHDAVIRWWVLCALESRCIAPTSDLSCSFHGRDQYAHCHRYDQSAMNILTANYHADDVSKYVPAITVVSVHRGSANSEFLKVCHTNKTIEMLKSQKYF